MKIFYFHIRFKNTPPGANAAKITVTAEHEQGARDEIASNLIDSNVVEEMLVTHCVNISESAPLVLDICPTDPSALKEFKKIPFNSYQA